MTTSLRRWELAALILASSAIGCSYTITKKSNLRMRRLPADSMQIVLLGSQLDSLRAQQLRDSTRCAALVKELQVAPPPPVAAANADSLLRAREQEIQTLRDQLTKVTTEMDRIKRRLASPKA